MLKKLLAAAFFCCAGTLADAGNTPVTIQIDRSLNPSPVCISRLTSGVCTPIGVISSANVWAPTGPNGSVFAASAFTDTTNASNISSGTLPPARLPGPTVSTPGGVQARTAPPNQYQTGIGTDGVPTFAQPSFGNLTGSITDAQVPSGLTLTAPILAGTPKTPALTGYLYGNGGTGWTASANIPATALSGTIDCLREPAQTGDVSSPAGSCAFTLATVNPNVGSFGGASSIPTFTVSGKGLITAAGTANIALAIGTTSVTGGSSGNSLYNNGGLIGERTTTGTGSAVLATSPTIATPTVNTPVISGGTANSITIGGITSAPGTFTALSSTSGALNGSIGGTTPGTGAFTNVSATNLTVANAPIFTALTGYVKGNGASAATASSTIPTSDLSGTALPAAIVTSSLTSVGTIGTGVWQGTRVGFAYLPQGGAATIRGNPSAATANVSDNTLSTYLDAEVGTTQGNIICRGASTWGVVIPNASGNVLTSNGSGVCPSYQAPASGGSGAPRSNVRQIVQSGPATSAGAANFLAATSGTLTPTAQNVSTTTPLTVSAAFGSNSTGLQDYVYEYTSNPTLAACTASSQCYEFENAQSGAFVSSTLAPIYQCGGTVSTASGQFTFDYCGGATGGTGTVAGRPFVGYMGNGTTAPATPLVALGECTAGASTLSGCIAYAYNGYFESTPITTSPALAVNTPYNTNIGVSSACRPQLVFNTSSNGYVAGDVLDGLTSYNGADYVNVGYGGRNTAGFTTSAAGAVGVWFYSNKTTGARVAQAASAAIPGTFRMICRRPW